MVVRGRSGSGEANERKLVGGERKALRTLLAEQLPRVARQNERGAEAALWAVAEQKFAAVDQGDVFDDR